MINFRIVFENQEWYIIHIDYLFFSISLLLFICVGQIYVLILYHSFLKVKKIENKDSETETRDFENKIQIRELKFVSSELKIEQQIFLLVFIFFFSFHVHTQTFFINSFFFSFLMLLLCFRVPLFKLKHFLLNSFSNFGFVKVVTLNALNCITLIIYNIALLCIGIIYAFEVKQAELQLITCSYFG